MNQTASSAPARHRRCCIVGGGPAGMMLGFLLARAGIDVVVLEKHADFLRDFRGDTIHPSTLQVMDELGLLDDFLRRPHSELREASGQIGTASVTIADFAHVPGRCKFIAFMPQWDFLDFLAGQARRFPSFRLDMESEAVDLVYDGGRVAGVTVRTPQDTSEIRADLVIGADGRHSLVRQRAGLESVDLGASMDVLWLRLAKRPGDRTQSLGRFDSGGIVVMLDRGDYWQCAFVIRKGGYDAVRQRGFDAFRQELARLTALPQDRMAELGGWSEVKLLTVALDRLRRWHNPGLLCIGDAAHAMSPIGGVGINLAIQDAVAAANILFPWLSGADAAAEPPLARVQQRRALPTRLTQAVQRFIQNRVVGPVLDSSKPLPLPLPLRLLQRWPWLRRIPARIIGVGFRPEHVQTPEAATP